MNRFNLAKAFTKNSSLTLCGDENIQPLPVGEAAVVSEHCEVYKGGRGCLPVRDKFMRFFGLRPLNDKNKRAAFTLAEVLITLGVIGVVSALTIPNLMTNYKAYRLKTQFWKSYSTLSQVIRRMNNDGVLYNPSEYEVGEFYKIVLKYISGGLDCGKISAKTAKGSPCYNANDSTQKPYSTLFGKTLGSGETFMQNGQIAMQDGSLLLFQSYRTGSAAFIISIDINGYNNPPNRLGYDMFAFKIDEMKGSLLPYKASDDNGNGIGDCSFSTVNQQGWYGWACSERAINEPDYFKELVRKIKL